MSVSVSGIKTKLTNHKLFAIKPIGKTPSKPSDIPVVMRVIKKMQNKNNPPNHEKVNDLMENILIKAYNNYNKRYINESPYKDNQFKLYFIYWPEDNGYATIAMMLFTECDVMLWSSHKMIELKETELMGCYKALYECLHMCQSLDVVNLTVVHEDKTLIDQLNGQAAVDEKLKESHDEVKLFSDRMKIKYELINDDEPTFLERALEGGEYTGRLDLPVLDLRNETYNYIMFSGITWSRHCADEI